MFKPFKCCMGGGGDSCPRAGGGDNPPTAGASSSAGVSGAGGGNNSPGAGASSGAGAGGGYNPPRAGPSSSAGAGGGDSPTRAGPSSSAGAGGLEGTSNLIWYQDNERHYCGVYSMAMFQANEVLEDQCQVVCGPLGTFVGIYDGHGGHQAAHYVRDNLYQNLLAISAAESQGVETDEIIRRAIRRTEQGFNQQVAELWDNNDDNAATMATTGTCCLIGVIHKKTLLVANVGDSRAVLCSKLADDNSDGHYDYRPVQASQEHDVNSDQIRVQLQDSHRDPEVVQKKQGVYRVKGIIQVCRSIGDLYLKNEQYNQAPILEKFRVKGRRLFPYLTARPDVRTYDLTSDDVFIIFASDGLWKCLKNEEAIHIVRAYPRGESAKKLVMGAALNKKRSLPSLPAALEDIPKDDRHNYFDDMSVVVLWLDHDAVFDQTTSIQSPDSIS